MVKGKMLEETGDWLSEDFRPIVYAGLWEEVPGKYTFDFHMNRIKRAITEHQGVSHAYIENLQDEIEIVRQYVYSNSEDPKDAENIMDNIDKLINRSYGLAEDL